MQHGISDPCPFEEISCACWLSLIWCLKQCFFQFSNQFTPLPHPNLKKREKILIAKPTSWENQRKPTSKLFVSPYHWKFSKTLSSCFSIPLTTLQPSIIIHPSSSRRAQPTSGLRGKSLAPGIISNRSWQREAGFTPVQLILWSSEMETWPTCDA